MMKKITFLVGIILLFSISVKSQVTLEHTYANIHSSYLSHSGLKYYVMDRVNNQVIFYNTDYSNWKTVNLDIPNNYTLNGVYLTSEGLFTTDTRLAFCYVYVNCDSLCYFGGKIIDEYENIILAIDSMAGAYAVKDDANNAKLVVSIYGNSEVYARIYSLPGSLYCNPCNENSSKGILIENNSFISANPNPSKNFTIIDYQLPQGTNSGEIFIYDLNGKIVKKYKVDRTFNHLKISTSDINSGTYFYTLQTTKGYCSSKKMIIIK